MSRGGHEGIAFIYPLKVAAAVTTGTLAPILVATRPSESISAGSFEAAWCSGCGPTIPAAVTALLAVGLILAAAIWHSHRRLEEVAE